MVHGLVLIEMYSALLAVVDMARRGAGPDEIDEVEEVRDVLMEMRDACEQAKS